MKLLLVNPPNALNDRKYLAPPLGLLTLAAAVRYQGHAVCVLDLNLEVIASPLLGDVEFYQIAHEMIVAYKPDIIGFTSMCLESHVSLELARRIKEVLPEVVNIFGGTHFGSIATDMLRNFSFVNFVVEGEGEDGLVAILDQLSTKRRSLPNNVWYRERQKVVSGIDGRKRFEVGELPFPAYDLVDLERYFVLNPDQLLNYEAGRGCVFKCSFCYSPFQYGDAVRNKAADRVVEDLQRLSHLGARHIFFVQDNLLNSPRWAADLCRNIADANLPLTWECYATYPQLSEALIDSLSEAGCVGIFTGIDAVTPESQVRMNKPFLKSWETTGRKLSYCREKGVLPICAFILEGPIRSTDKIDSTILTALECLKLGCEIHLNTLTLYNGTALASDMNTRPRFYSQIKPELLFDTPKLVQVNNLARTWPHLFPYHSTDMDVDQWETFTTKVFTLYAVMIALRKTTYEYATAEGRSLWEVLGYVDQQYVELIRQLSSQERRLEAILRFARHFIRLKPSVQTEALLRRELAQVILAARDKERLVTLEVDGSVEDFVLGWFIFISANQDLNFDDDASDELVLDSQLALGVTSPVSTPRQDCILALRSEKCSIRYYEIDLDKVEMLCALSLASREGRSFTLTAESLSLLIEEGWVWPAANWNASLPGLPIRPSARRITQNFRQTGKNL